MKTLRRFIATNEILMTATVTARVVGNVEGPDDSSPTDFSFMTFHEFLFDEFSRFFPMTSFPGSCQKRSGSQSSYSRVGVFECT